MELHYNYLLLHGGVDIDPARYGQKKNPFTQTPNHRRDEEEFKATHRAMEDGFPVIGICRGAQLLCIAHGGSLWQDTWNHGSPHLLHTVDGDVKKATSCHHQVMNLNGAEEHILLAWADEEQVWGESHLLEDATNLIKVPEVVWFPRTKCLAIQPHPEWEDASSPFRQWLDKKIVELYGFKVDF